MENIQKSLPIIALLLKDFLVITHSSIKILENWNNELPNSQKKFLKIFAEFLIVLSLTVFSVFRDLRYIIASQYLILIMNNKNE
jgi:hypothetical protein